MNDEQMTQSIKCFHIVTSDRAKIFLLNFNPIHKRSCKHNYLFLLSSRLICISSINRFRGMMLTASNILLTLENFIDDNVRHDKM